MSHIFFRLNYLNVFIIAFLIAGLSGCSNIYYIPKVSNAPIHKEEGELKIASYLTIGEKTNSFDLQSSASVSDNVAVMVNFQTAYNTKNSNNSDFENSFQLEAGLGYFTVIKEEFSLAVFGGGGIGEVEFNLPGFGDIKLNTPQYFIQPQVGIIDGGFETVLSTRFLIMDYKGIPQNLNVGGQRELNFRESVTSKASIFFEPAITSSYGNESVKVRVQLAGSSNLSNENFKQKGLMLTIGLELNIATNKPLKD